MNTKRYETDLTDEQWNLLQPLVAQKPGRGRPRKVDIRRVLDGIFYLLRTSCQWRFLPGDFPPWQDVYYYFAKWQEDGTLERIHDTLREKVREQEKPNHPPKTASIDSQTSKSAGAREEVGYDGAKKTNGRKRHIIVDSLGLLLAVSVTTAALADEHAGSQLLAQLDRASLPHLRTLYADSSYNRAPFPESVQQLGWLVLETVRRPPGSKGWIRLPKRWVVERTFAWISRNRRLCRSYEHTTRSELALVRLSMIKLMTNRLTCSCQS
jgi:putative transposase